MRPQQTYGSTFLLLAKWYLKQKEVDTFFWRKILLKIFSHWRFQKIPTIKDKKAKKVRSLLLGTIL
jgi:hypothetical protein